MSKVILVSFIALNISLLSYAEQSYGRRQRPPSSHQNPAQASNSRRHAPLNIDQETAKRLKLSLARMQTVKGEAVKSERPKHTVFEYLSPNEIYSPLFDPCIEDKDGALVSVGTFRALNLASNGKVKHLVLFDYNQAVNLFNMVNLQLLELSEDRYEYLSLLLTGSRNTQLVEEARNQKMDASSFAEKLLRSQAMNRGTSNSSYLASQWQNLGVQMRSQEDWNILAKNGGASLATEILKNFPKSLRDYKSANALQNTIFGNDQRFQNAKSLATSGSVTVMNGSLTNSEGLTSLARALREKGIAISAFDVSNAPSYFRDSKESLRALQKNIDRLPFTPNGRVFMTWQGHYYINKKDNYSSLVRAHRQNLRDMELNLFGESDINVMAKPHDQIQWMYHSIPHDRVDDLGLFLTDQSQQQNYASRSDYVTHKLMDNFSADPDRNNDYGILRTLPEARCD